MKKILGFFILGISALGSNAQWNPNTSVNMEVSTLSIADMQSLSTLDGKTWVVYFHAVASNHHLYAQLLDVDGSKLLGPDGVLVSDKPSGTATYVFNICLENEGGVLIGTQDQRLGSGNTAVGYKIDQSGNSSWNNGDGVVLGAGLSPSLVVLSTDDVVFAWSGSNNNINMQKVTPAGTAVWTTPKSVTSTTGRSSRGQMTAMSDGAYVMAYQATSFGINSTMFAQRYDNNGDVVWPAAVKLSDQATSAARYYSIRQEADTTYFGYYTSSTGNHFNSWLQRINPDGTLPYGINGAAFSDYSTNADPHEMTTAIAVDPNTPFVWAVSTFSNPSQSNLGVYVQKFNKEDGQRLLNTNGKEVYAISPQRQSQAGALTLKNGYPVFMFIDDAQVIKGTVLNQDGDFLLPTPDTELSSTVITQPTALYKGRLGFTENVNDQSVALWTEDRGTGYKGYAQNFVLDMLDTSIRVKTVNDVPAVINTFQGTLDLTSAILPSSANQDVTWVIIPGTGNASISTLGVVTAVSDGDVWAKATSVAAPAFSDSIKIEITDQIIMSVSDLEKSIGFQLYPNPTTKSFSLQVKAAHSALSIQLTDVLGRTVSEMTVPSNALNTQFVVDMSANAPGTYLMSIRGKGIDIKRKVVKMEL